MYVRSMLRTVFPALSLLAVPLTALASPPGLDGAVDAWLDEDYSQMATIATYAKAGNVEAMAVYGQSLWFGMGMLKDRTRGLQYMQRAAETGDRPSAVQLGRIYAMGHPEAPKSDAMAAKYFVIAAKNGEKFTAPRELKALPRDVVIAAGGAQWAAPATGPYAKPAQSTFTPKGKTPPAPPEAPSSEFKPTYAQQESLNTVDRMFGHDEKPVSKPLPAPKPQPASPAKKRTDAQMKKQAEDMMEALFGPTVKLAPPYQLRDGSQFRILTDTDFSTSGDAAATCFAVLHPVMESKSIKLNEMVLGMRANPKDLALKSRAAVLSTEVSTLLTYSQYANKIMTDPKQNGGLDPAQTEAAYRLHVQVKNKWPDTAPSVRECQNRLPSVMADIAISETRGHYWNR